MTYTTIEHTKVRVGQRWSCTSGAESIVVVAVDSFPGGTVVNVLIDAIDGSGEQKTVLAPVEWEQLNPALREVLGTGVDVSQQVERYLEWKSLANDGKAGIWTCGIAKILENALRAATP